MWNFTATITLYSLTYYKIRLKSKVLPSSRPVG